MTALTQGTCRCGRPASRDVTGLTGSFLKLAERLAVICPACAAEAEAQVDGEQQGIAAARQRDQVTEWRSWSGMPLALRGLSWAAIDGHPDALEHAYAWADGQLRGLVLTGPVGVGKTHLAATAAWAHLHRAPMRWITTPMLLASLARAWDDDARQEILGVLVGTRSLVLDDIDKTRLSRYAAEQLFTAIDQRVTNNAQLLITTNLTLGELARQLPAPFGEAICSRLAAYCQICNLDGPDRRTA